MQSVRRMSLFETISESTPQFLLQVSYIMRFGDGEWEQLVSIAISFLSIWRQVTSFSVSTEAIWTLRIAAAFNIAIGTIPKLIVSSVIVAYLRYYSIVVMFVNATIIVTIACMNNNMDARKYYRGLFNYVVQDSIASGLGMGVALLQWILVAANLLTTILVVELAETPFADEKPLIRAHTVDTLGLPGLCTLTGIIIAIFAAVVELTSHRYLATVWASEVNEPV